MAKPRPTARQAPEVCPVCDADVPRGAAACPECGADHNSGWRDDADTGGGLDLADDDFNYDEFVQREFGGSPKPSGVKVMWWIAAILLLVALVAIYFASVL